MFVSVLADVVPVPAAPVTIGPGAWLSVASNLGGLAVATITLLTTGRRWLGNRVAEAATAAVEKNVLPKLVDLTTAIERINTRLDEYSTAARTMEMRLSDLVRRVDMHASRIDDHAHRLEQTGRPRRTTT